MSFILDALKKSEKERQRETVPGIGDLPVVVHHVQTSSWVFGIIAALGLGIVALAWTWWRTLEPEHVTVVNPRSMPASTVQAPGAEPAAVESQPPARRPETRSLASEVTRATAVPTRPPAVSAAAEPLIMAPRPAVITLAPMSIIEARAAGLAVSELTLELLVYSPEPTQRFVYINASKYVEGDVLAEGPRVIEISTEGAILSYRGQNFLLPQE